MPNYIINTSDDGATYNVGVTGSNGARQTMLGFTDEAEAEAWIVQDRRLTLASEAAAAFSRPAAPPD